MPAWPILLGCERICKGGAQLNPPQTAISIVATWARTPHPTITNNTTNTANRPPEQVFPLTVLLSLPFESSHGGHFWRAVRNTLASTSVWLGSPPTALASALFELHQVGQCSRRARQASNRGVSAQLQRDAYFVLMCANQFHMPPARAEALLRALFYGLARPLSARPDVTVPGAEREQREMALAARLLGEMAAQLRALQAGNVKRTLVSLGTFVAAFVFASVLAFGDFGESTTIFILSLGLLFCWLPMLVALTCVIPNRVSPGRQRELISRWLYNNAAIEAWFHPPPAANNDKKATDPDAGIPWWSPSTPAEDTAPYLVGSLISHGRSLRHCSLLTSSFLAHTSHTSSTSTTPLSFTTSTNTNANNNIKPWTHSTTTQHAALIASDLLRGRPPASWYAIAVASLGLVWAEALLSFTCDFLTPTVGLGCWSGCALLYAVLSGAAAGANWLAVAHVGNFVALAWLATITGIIGFAFYRNHFDVVVPWAACSGIGAALLAVVFVIAGVRWLRCRRLWAAAKEQTGDGGLDDGEAYELDVGVHPGMMAWLQH
ncbi:hypothetical protein B0T24DRAFT_577272 [Lasiosphaeria ovina]|uniref:Transmembrane protein n=1 Tax=Lasiosphaeria ovina TaxID=92902 RepID=A0AAE0N840_9PEZI|nr:hypothetical protein B0T24DRAFT_577272 [Lasiosphaeria ovina]